MVANGHHCKAIVISTQVAKRDETILSLQSELDATQQEYETLSTELSERETEVAEMKAKNGELDKELKGLRVQRESDENKVKCCLLCNPLSPKSDQHQISPYSINTYIKREGNENQGHDHQMEIPRCELYSQTGCSFPRNFANFRRNVGILIGSLL